MNEKKKICFVSLFAYGLFNPTADLKFGGSETQLFLIGKKLAEIGEFDISFIVLDVGQRKVEIYDRVKVIKAYRRGKNVFNQISGFFRLLAALRQSDPDIIVCRAFGREVGVAALYAKIFRKKLVYCFANDHDADGTFFQGLAGKIFQFGFKAADWYVAQSQRQRENFQTGFEKKSDKITLIKNSWPAEVMPPVEKNTILWVGSSAFLKRPEIFLDLAEAFPQEKFVMIMTKSNMGVNGWEEIVARARRLTNLQLEASVPFREIGAYFSRAKILVNTSSSEGFPNVFLQAAAAKTPLLTMTVDPDDFIKKNNCGIVAENDIGKLKEGLRVLLSDDKSRDQMGENLYRYFKAEHDLDINIKKWSELFHVL